MSGSRTWLKKSTRPSSSAAAPSGGCRRYGTDVVAAGGSPHVGRLLRSRDCGPQGGPTTGVRNLWWRPFRLPGSRERPSGDVDAGVRVSGGRDPGRAGGLLARGAHVRAPGDAGDHCRDHRGRVPRIGDLDEPRRPKPAWLLTAGIHSSRVVFTLCSLSRRPAPGPQ